ncbi:vacuolar glutathione S-conjugate transporter, partial [Talaromyces pinophilus]
MIDGNLQLVIGNDRGSTGPFYTAANPLHASTTLRQPFCRDSEGWGPINSDIADFTPCFVDVPVSIAAAWGVVMGVGALWLLLKRREPQDVPKNWHFYAKLVVLALLLTSTVTQGHFQLLSYSRLYIAPDFRFWATVLTLASLVVIFAVQYFEHWRSRQPNGVVLFYWVFFIIAHGIKLRSLVTREVFRYQLPYFIVVTISLALAVVEFILEYLVPKKQSAYDTLGKEDECPYEYADIFSILTFSWMTPMMKYGYKAFLTQDDMWNLRDRDTTKTTGTLLEDSWGIELDKKSPSLWIALFRAFGGPYMRGAIIKCGSDILAFVQPQLLRYLISFVDSYRTPTPQPVARGVAIALAMFAVSVCQTACLHQYFQRAFETGMRVKSALTGLIYSKALRLSNEGRSAKTTGDIVNHMAVDQQRLVDLTQFGTQLWSAPFQITLCMVSLYQLVGNSMWAGIGVMILMIPINGMIARMMKTLQIVQMKNKDSRTRLMTEILNNMKSIKLYAWNKAFMGKLSHIRNDLELNTLRKIGATQAVANFTWSSTPFLVSCTTFAVFVLIDDRPLTTDLVFPALTLFNLLTFPLSILPMVITSIIEASVAVRRLTDYLTADELQEDAVLFQEPVTHNGDESVRIRDASFTWNKYQANNVLE